jgi:hypothetical protein
VAMRHLLAIARAGERAGHPRRMQFAASSV